MRRRPAFEVKIPALKDELQYITGELIPKYSLYKKAGYSPKIPIVQWQKVQDWYDEKSYEKAAKRLLKTTRKNWKKLFQTFSKWPGFILFPKYELRLTKFGTGGDYFPSYGAFDGKLRPQPGKNLFPKDKRAIILLKLNDKNNFSRDPLEIITHEIIHLGIEKPVVRKYELSHKQKEALVDKLCLLKFSKLLPKYKAQKITGKLKTNVLEKIDLLLFN